MTIDKQKLIQWIENKQEVFSPPYEDHELDKVYYWKGMCNMLVRLKQAIELGELNVKEAYVNAVLEIRALQQQNKQLIEALEWYANKKHYTDGQANVYDGDILDSSVKWDEGEIALTVLQQIQGKDEV